MNVQLCADKHIKVLNEFSYNELRFNDIVAGQVQILR